MLQAVIKPSYLLFSKYNLKSLKAHWLLLTIILNLVGHPALAEVSDKVVIDRNGLARPKIIEGISGGENPRS